jgi:hypothetical protein
MPSWLEVKEGIVKVIVFALIFYAIPTAAKWIWRGGEIEHSYSTVEHFKWWKRISAPT